jgi:hypothetical protein
VQTSYQPFEHGEMIWSDHVAWYPQPVICVLYADSTYQRLDDTFDPASDPIDSNQIPPRGFGKVWRDQPGVRKRLGWATSSATPGAGQFQMFLDGDMVWISQTNQTYVFLAKDSVVRAYNLPFSDE